MSIASIIGLDKLPDEVQQAFNNLLQAVDQALSTTENNVAASLATAEGNISKVGVRYCGAVGRLD